MSGVEAPNARFRTSSDAVSTSVRKSLAAFAVRTCGWSRPERRTVTASSTAACAAASSRSCSTPRTLTRHGDEHGRLAARVVQPPEGNALEVEEIAAAERAGGARAAVQLDLPRADEDERVAPLGLVVGMVDAGRDRHDVDVHGVSGNPNAANVELSKVTISATSPPAIVSRSSAIGLNRSAPGLRR